ncbi:uncharacterized protein LOC135089373 [Scylla paramamosain]|uniref:uncharacterized protein LOC135089373 n=1 Tax=Scylla paramamosain TaxID=85552 RepID=UPI003082DD30
MFALRSLVVVVVALLALMCLTEAAPGGQYYGSSHGSFGGGGFGGRFGSHSSHGGHVGGYGSYGGHSSHGYVRPRPSYGEHSDSGNEDASAAAVGAGRGGTCDALGSSGEDGDRPLLNNPSCASVCNFPKNSKAHRQKRTGACGQ